MSTRITAFTSLAKVSGLTAMKRVNMRIAPMATVRSRYLTNVFTLPMEEHERMIFERDENEYMKGVLNAEDVEWRQENMYTLGHNHEANPMINRTDTPIDDLWDDLINEKSD